MLNVAWWSTGQRGWVIIPANFLAGVTIALHWIACNGLHLPVNRKSWGTILLILAVGTVWNIMAPFLLSPFLRIR